MAMTAHSKSGLAMRIGSVVERRLERTAEAGLDHDPAELAAHRVFDLLRHGLDALHQRVAGAERAREQLERVGQLADERGLALPGFVVEE